MAFEVVRSEKKYEGRVFNVRQDEVRMPGGKLVKLDIVDHRGAVTLLPLDESGQIWFIRQYRHPAGVEILELPAGVMESEEDAPGSAGRELREEIGMGARELKLLGEFFLAPGYSTEFMRVYLATGLYPAPLDQDEDEVIRVEKIPAGDALHMAENGQIQDAKTLAALLLARPYLLAF
jgi:ADP-ribose pyrophosphatase